MYTTSPDLCHIYVFNNKTTIMLYCLTLSQIGALPSSEYWIILVALESPCERFQPPRVLQWCLNLVWCDTRETACLGKDICSPLRRLCDLTRHSLRSLVEFPAAFGTFRPSWVWNWAAIQLAIECHGQSEGLVEESIYSSFGLYHGNARDSCIPQFLLDSNHAVANTTVFIRMLNWCF